MCIRRWSRLPGWLLVAALLGAPGMASAQGTGRIVGTVRAESGQALSGVSVLVAGTRLGALSGADGRYSIAGVGAGTYTVRAKSLGYADGVLSVRVNGGETATLDFVLRTQAVELQAVVAVGYATQRQRNVSGSVTTVSAAQLDPVATTSVNQMLEGKAPGLNTTLRSAQPGGGVSVNIRGGISPRGNNTPLYVIDGVPMTQYQSSVPGLITDQVGFYGGVDRDPLAYLNPADIESVTVLKDASAAAIYGSAAANGVVLITTKTGRAGAVRVNYRATYSAETPQDYMPVMNAQQFMTQQSRLAYDRYLFDNKLAPYGTRDPSQAPAYIPLFTPGQISAPGVGTNWPALVMRDGHAQEHTISLTGGSATTYVYSSFDYRTEDAVLKNSQLNKFSARFNIDQTIGERVHLSLKATGTRFDANNASSGTNSGGPEKYNVLQSATTYAPTVPVYDSAGNYVYSYYRTVMNPAAFLTITDNSMTTTLFAAPNLQVQLTDHLKANLTGEVDQESTDRGFYLPRTTNNDILQNGAAQKSTYTVDNYSTEGYLTYANTWGRHDVTAVAGAGFYQAGTEYAGAQAQDFFTDAFGYNNMGVGDPALNKVYSSKSVRNKLSQFGRINYTFADRYILALVARRDGSSIFAENHKYGFFPGISGAWIVSDEGFFHRRLPQVSQLKLRAGFGEAGNESVLQGNTLQLYSPGYSYLVGGTLVNGVALSQAANPNLRWETMKTVNLGVDVGIWNQRLSGSFDYFVKTAENLLDFNPLPSNNAVGLVADNVGSTRSRGWEVALHSTNLAGSTLRWTTDANFSHDYAYWLQRNPKTPLPSYIGAHDAFDQIYGWQATGLIRSDADKPAYMPDAYPGNLAYKDQNGDAQLDSADVVKIGNSMPRWHFSIGNTITFHHFDVSAFLYGAAGFKRTNNFNPDVFGISQPTTPSNTTIYARDVWSASNPNGTLPGVAQNPYDVNNPAGTSDFWYKDASYLRLKNVSVGYTLPKWMPGLGPQRSARLFVDIENLKVFTNYPGFDPELTEGGAPYPKAYTTTFGIEANF